jgi:hypothetical protein
MRIGLVRHFKVHHPFPDKKLLSKAEVIKWFEDYDNTENIQYKTVDLHGINWQRCYSSTMIRSVNTAKHILPELSELGILHQLWDKIKLPFLIWGVIVRIKSFSSNPDTNKFKSGITEFIDQLLNRSEDETLIVSHWFVMRVIRQELIKRGFVGEKFRSNEYGTLYVFENTGE